MTHVTIDVNDEWLEAARDILDTQTKVATVNEALRSFVVRKQAQEILAAVNSADMDYSGSAEAWRFSGGRDLARVIEDAQEPRSA
ncbi:MAG: type II toxin-antitoxin system VapB family antitoxin [Pseudonocardiaceae bacterium]